MIEKLLEAGHAWLRIARPHYEDPLDPTHAQQRGGRWNPPGSWPTLYLNHDMATVHAQVRHLFVGRGIDVDDLDDDAPILLVAATLPARQRVADLTSEAGLAKVELPRTYPVDEKGHPVAHEASRAVGEDVHRARLRGVLCRSAATADGSGRELAWFPSARGRARALWPRPLAFGRWRYARALEEIGQPLNRSRKRKTGRSG